MLPTNRFSVGPLKVELLAGEQKATESTFRGLPIAIQGKPRGTPSTEESPKNEKSIFFFGAYSKRRSAKHFWVPRPLELEKAMLDPVHIGVQVLSLVWFAFNYQPKGDTI